MYLRMVTFRVYRVIPECKEGLPLLKLHKGHSYLFPVTTSVLSGNDKL